jgi:hypothetical protein
MMNALDRFTGKPVPDDEACSFFFCILNPDIFFRNAGNARSRGKCILYFKRKQGALRTTSKGSER